ncbi:hypothetical protein ACHAXT_012752 [Thalassiosira profunda]
MAEPDELYTLRAQYWLGHFAMALDEGRQAARRPLPPHLKSEREEFVLRSLLAMGNHDKVMADGGGADKSAACRVLALHAQYLSSAPEARGSVVDELKALVASSPGDTSLQLTACHVFLAAGQVKEALACVHHGLTMEHLAMAVQIYIQIDRLDLAAAQLDLLRQADEDSILAQLTSAYLAIAQGSSKSDDAVHILAGLSEQYGPSLTLLNATAAANMVGGKYDAALQNLRAAIEEFGGESDPDTLVNMAACSQHLGKKEEVEKYVGIMKATCGEHPYVQGLATVEGAFDREASKYLTA